MKKLLLPIVLFSGLLAACARGEEPPSVELQGRTPAELVEEGDALLIQSDFRGAIAAYEAAIEQDPEHAAAYSHLALAHLYSPATQKDAIAEARQATEISPGSAEAWAYLARAYDWNGDFDAALEAAERALQLNSNDADVQSYLSEIYADLRHSDKARQAAENAVRLDPNSAEAQHKLAYVYADMGMKAEALDAYTRALELEPEFVHRHTSLAAHHLFRLDDDEAAGEYLASAAELAPDDYITLLFSSRLASRRGQTQAALAYCREVLDLAPGSAEGFGCLGGAYRDAGEYFAARDAWEAAINADPQDENGYLGLGYVYVAVGDCEEAVRQFSRAVDIHPRTGDNHAALAFAYGCSGRIDQAEAAYLEAIELEPYDADHRLLLGRLYLDTGRLEQAEAAFQAAQALDSAEDRYTAWLARAYLAEGRFSDAVTQFERAAEMDPEDPAHPQAIGYAYLNTDRDPEVAAGYFEAALELYALHGGSNVEVAQARYGLGVSHLSRNDCSSAMPHLQEAYRLDPSLALARVHLLQCREIVGFDNATLPAELIQRSPVAGPGALTTLVDSLSIMGIDAEAEFQSTADGAEVLAIAHLALSEPGTRGFIQERALVMNAGSLVAARLTYPQVDGLLVFTLDTQGQPASALLVRIQDAWLWELGVLELGEYASFWRDLQQAAGAGAPR